jgi:predicted dehydrogenase
MSEKKVTLIVAGAGGRGTGYARIAADAGRAQVVGVAEPRDFFRDGMIARHGISPENVYTDWKDLAARDRFADAVIIATQDRMHVEPAVAFAAKGYDILLEKPMAPDAAGCRRIVNAATDAGVLFGVCHVMRYTDYSRKLVSLLRGGLIGDVVSIQHLEPVGYWHQAHSFVRGHWRNEAHSSFMLLAKSCHDLDWIRHVMGVPCERVSSFGSLYHFRKKCAPEGAAKRCLDCPVEPTCPYSARKIYIGQLNRGETGWPVNVVHPEPTVENVTEALRTGQYGRCVYACDNDVVDHQVVNMEFAGGKSAAFTMTAFNFGRGRETRIFGTRGELYGDGSKLVHNDFLTDKTTEIDTRAPDASITGGHGGGDERLIEAFIDAVATRDANKILSGPAESLETHLMVFAAEQARRNGSVEKVQA